MCSMKSERKRQRDVLLLVYSKVTRHLKHCVCDLWRLRTLVFSSLDRNILHAVKVININIVFYQYTIYR